MSRKQTPLMNRIVALGVVAAVTLYVAVRYVQMVRPAAAREVKAACNGLRPSPDNPVFGALPSSQPVEFKAQNHEGKTVSLSDYRGKVVFVNFWATWCNVCKAEKPGLEELARELEDGEDFVILTLASNAAWKDIRDYFPSGTPLTVLLDPPTGDDNLGTIAKSFGITAVPESFVIDRDGHIRHYFINKRDWDSGVAQTCLQALIDE